ncbi:MAG: 30S ribosomal protein S3 [bacterium]|nr:30S ribosomal protein S3 [bacterium]
MGRKVHPKAFRMGEKFTWTSRWFADKRKYKDFLIQDVKLRSALMEKLANAGIAEVVIERSISTVKVVIYVARPGVAIGRGGQNLEVIKKYIMSFFEAGAQSARIEIQVEPVSAPSLNAHLVGKNIAEQIERRIPHRRAVYRAIEQVMGAGAKGVQIMLSGRIRGAEIARVEKYKEGSIPMSTIREEIDFAVVPALTKSGYVGIKVWICRKS